MRHECRAVHQRSTGGVGVAPTTWCSNNHYSSSHKITKFQILFHNTFYIMSIMLRILLVAVIIVSIYQFGYVQGKLSELIPK